MEVASGIETVRALVRPSVTWLLVVAFVVAAFHDREVAAVVGGPMGIAVGYYFKAREG